MNSYWDEDKKVRQVYHIGAQGKEAIIEPDGYIHGAYLTMKERDELRIWRRTRKLLAQASKDLQEYLELSDIPYEVEVDPLSTFTEIVKKKMKPEQAKQYLLELRRYYWLLRRG